MTYYVLTKRSAPSDGGKLTHQIYGCSTLISVARAWFRATVVTDVVELECESNWCGEYVDQDAVIRDSRMVSWREAKLKQEKA
jgi:hypothetical protein